MANIFSLDMREQVDAAVWLIKSNLYPSMGDYQEKYLREMISNTVQSCFSVSQQEDQKKGQDHGKK